METEPLSRQREPRAASRHEGGRGPEHRALGGGLHPDRVALFLNALSAGGAERNMLAFARWLVGEGYSVDLVLGQRRGGLVDAVPSGVRVVELPMRRPAMSLAALPRLPLSSWGDFAHLAFRSRLLGSLLPLAEYLEVEMPVALMTTITKNVLLALWARELSGAPTRLVIREANVFSMQHQPASSRNNPILTRLARRWYPKADAVIAVSAGVADDLAETVEVPRSGITTIYNPVDFELVSARGREPLDDPWFRPGQPPVLVSAGRLSEQKDFATLIRGFAILRRERAVRLIVLGEGRLRAQLEALCRELRVEADVSLAGATPNPHAYMARAAAFVLSSRWEGCANVVTEALACGCPVVSTDCRSGPREMLEGGRHGRLVAPGDAIGLAKAIAEILDEPPDRDQLRCRAREFPPGPTFTRYRDVLLGRTAE